MKTNAKLRTYYLRQVGVIEAILQKSGKDFTEEDFHNLRLGIKKIKAVLSFLRFCDPDFNQEKHFKPFADLFSQAGEVREIQIQQAMLKDHSSSPLLKSYFDDLSTSLRDHQAAFAARIDRKLKKKIRSSVKKAHAFLKNVSSRLMNQYLQDEQSRIKILLNADKLEKKQVHALRKQIKDIYYLQKIFQPKDKRLLVADEFQEMLGQWHDYRVVAKDLLNGAQNHNLQPPEVKALMTLRKNILARADRLLMKIETARKTI
jgi:CHAD domain-containing protein